MSKNEELKLEIMGLYIEVEHMSESARAFKNAGVVAYLKCAASFLDAALETLKTEEEGK